MQKQIPASLLSTLDVALKESLQRLIFARSVMERGNVKSMDVKYAVIGEDGWISPQDPPDTDRAVQLAWDDMSYSKDSLGFRDMKSEKPQSGRYYWWSLREGYSYLSLIPDESIGAWREVRK